MLDHALSHPAAAAPAAEDDVIDLDGPDGGADAATAADDGGADGDAGPGRPPGLPAHAELRPDGSVRLPLERPVALRFRKAGQVREETVAELVLHRLTGADLRAIGAARAADAATVALARSARMAEARFNPIYDRMDGADASAAEAVVAVFLGGGRGRAKRA